MLVLQMLLQLPIVGRSNRVLMEKHERSLHGACEIDVFVWNRLVLATPYIIPLGAGYTQVRTQYRLYGTPVLYNCALESTLVGDTLFPTHCFSVLVLIWPSCGQDRTVVGLRS